MTQAQLDDERAKLTGFDEELRELEEAMQSKNSRITEEGLEMQKLGHQLEKLQKDQNTAAQSVAYMEEEHEWIADEKDNFGRSNTAYDFKNQNIAECKSTLRNVTERFQGMKNKINPKVMNMIDSVEKKEAALKNMMKTVIRDKRKIEETIINLNEYKKEALHKTWVKVNADFGQIFSELLPGSFAKLDPPEGKDITDGLEVKVSLGKVWKQSLTELSGGQRYAKYPHSCSLYYKEHPQLTRCSLVDLSLPSRSSWRSCNSSPHRCISWTKSMLRLTCLTPRTLAV